MKEITIEDVQELYHKLPKRGKSKYIRHASVVFDRRTSSLKSNWFGGSWDIPLDKITIVYDNLTDYHKELKKAV